MVKPTEAEKAILLVENELKDNLVKTMEAEQRTKLLLSMLRSGLMTREVKKVLKKQLNSKRRSKKTNLTLQKGLMKGCIQDSRKDEFLLRKERIKLKKRLLKMYKDDNGKMMKTLSRMRKKVVRLKKKIQKKNKVKLARYRKEKEDKELEELSKLPEELRDYASLRIFQNIHIQPEEPKPPVITSDTIELSEDELAVLKKGPKFTLRNILDKEAFMAEVEKGIVKKMYSDIGKEDDDKDTMEDGDKEEMKRVDDIAEWIELNLP